MNHSTQERNQIDVSRLLREAGYKATPARLAVTHVLTIARKPLTVQDVIDQLKVSSMDPVTVYRALNVLTTAGVVRRIDFRQGRALYELQDESDHHHVVCIKCQRVEDVEKCSVEEMNSSTLQQSGFAEILQHSLEFFGVCKNCKAARV